MARASNSKSDPGQPGQLQTAHNRQWLIESCHYDTVFLPLIYSAPPRNGQRKSKKVQTSCVELGRKFTYSCIFDQHMAKLKGLYKKMIAATMRPGESCLWL